MDLSKSITDIWEENKLGFENKLSRWVRALNCGKDVSMLAKKEFHQWKPLKTYISVSKASSASQAKYSMRFYGQEVANLIVKNKEVLLRLKGHVQKNEHWFGVKTKDGDYPWRSEVAKDFRLNFKEFAKEQNGFPDVRSSEHRIETKFISEMCKGAGKFNIPGLQIQPVLIAGKFPLQVPVPISANTGKPKAGNGYIDILARRKAEDNKVRLSVWELKGPGEYKYAASQAYIYAYTILQILRQSKSKKEWYKLFGFESKIPSSLTVEAVVAITKDQQGKFLKEKNSLMKRVPFDLGRDSIKLFVAYYQEKPDSIKLEQNPFSR